VHILGWRLPVEVALSQATVSYVDFDSNYCTVVTSKDTLQQKYTDAITRGCVRVHALSDKLSNTALRSQYKLVHGHAAWTC
jgi:hypothetical protein